MRLVTVTGTQLRAEGRQLRTWLEVSVKCQGVEPLVAVPLKTTSPATLEGATGEAIRKRKQRGKTIRKVLRFPVCRFPLRRTRLPIVDSPPDSLRRRPVQPLFGSCPGTQVSLGKEKLGCAAITLVRPSPYPACQFEQERAAFSAPQTQVAAGRASGRFVGGSHRIPSGSLSHSGSVNIKKCSVHHRVKSSLRPNWAISYILEAAHHAPALIPTPN